MTLASLSLAAFFSMLIGCSALERVFPRRVRVAETGPRWLANLSLGALGALVRLLLPFAAIGAAYRAEELQFGLLNRWELYFPLKFALSVLLLDLLVYAQHRLFHAAPALWRLHAVHHTDLDLDATSGVRFHPGEILVSTLIKVAGVSLLGAHFLAVATFEALLFSSSIFSHSNIALPGFLDRVLRLFVVTPDMHRVHHSPSRDETDSNFGSALPWWDRFFGTYRAQPREPHESMTLGLDGARDPRALSLFCLLGRPFRRTA